MIVTDEGEMNGNKPAHPCSLKTIVRGSLVNVTELGLTKREMIAAMAMQGILASLTDESDMTPYELARTAVRNADALLAELEKSG